jgi:hypothetical protein
VSTYSPSAGDNIFPLWLFFCFSLRAEGREEIKTRHDDPNDETLGSFWDTMDNQAFMFVMFRLIKSRNYFVSIEV